MSLTSKDMQQLVGLFEEVATNALRPVHALAKELDARMREVEALREELDADIRAVRAAANLRDAIREMVATEKESGS